MYNFVKRWRSMAGGQASKRHLNRFIRFYTTRHSRYTRIIVFAKWRQSASHGTRRSWLSYRYDVSLMECWAWCITCTHHCSGITKGAKVAYRNQLLLFVVGSLFRHYLFPCTLHSISVSPSPLCPANWGRMGAHPQMGGALYCFCPLVPRTLVTPLLQCDGSVTICSPPTTIAVLSGNSAMPTTTASDKGNLVYYTTSYSHFQ